MFKEIRYTLFLLVIFFFIFFTIKYYFSDENKKKSYRSMKIINKKNNNYSLNLFSLKSDTENIIEYVENNHNKKRKSFYFWSLLDND